MTNASLFPLKCVLLYLILSNLSTQKVHGQNMILNGGFETGTPGASSLPKYWYNCGSKGYTPPNLHSSKLENNIFDVKTIAFEGQQFVSLVVRKDQSLECIGQRLQSILQKDSIYSLDLQLNFSETFNSRTDLNSKNETSFSMAADLEIYAINPSGQYILLDVYTDINNPTWKNYNTTFKASENFVALEFRTYFQFDQLLPYNGHLLIDQVRLCRIDIL